MPKDQIAIISDTEVPPKFYALFNSPNIEMFRNEFKSFCVTDREYAIQLYEKMLKVKKRVLTEMKRMVNE